MSILIKGMKMPEHCGYCRFAYDGICHALQVMRYDKETKDGKLIDCPLTEIPTPHGRLIDADRLLRTEIKHLYYHLPNGDTAIPIIDVEHAPTIIEAEGEE